MGQTASKPNERTFPVGDLRVTIEEITEGEQVTRVNIKTITDTVGVEDLSPTSRIPPSVMDKLETDYRVNYPQVVITYQGRPV